MPVLDGTISQMDEYLDSLGYWRKQMAADGSCLFRAVSEHVYDTQSHHLAVRRVCVQHIRANSHVYKKFIAADIEMYASNMEDPKAWGGHMEMHAMAAVYRRDFLIFDRPCRDPYYATENGFPDVVMLCYTQGSHYDVVYPKSKLSATALCQSIVYEVLYKKVFELGEDVDLAVKKMLYDKAYFKHKKNMTFDQWKESVKFGTETNVLSEEEQATASEVMVALANKIPPFPFKVAKALDPVIYRNVEYDLWNEAERERLRAEQLVTPDLGPGVKCLVRLTNDEEGHSASFHGHIQKMEPNKGPVTVFIEKLGKMCTISYESVQALPLPVYKALTLQQGLVPHKLRSCIYKETLLSSLQDIHKSQRKILRKEKTGTKECSMWMPAVAGGTRLPFDFSGARRPDFNSPSPHLFKGSDIFAADNKLRFPLSPSPPLDRNQVLWNQQAQTLPPGSPRPLPQPIVYQENPRCQAHAVFDFKLSADMTSKYSDAPLRSDINDPNGISHGYRSPPPSGQQTESPFYNSFSTVFGPSSLLGQTSPLTDSGFLGSPVSPHYEYVPPPSYSYGAPSPGVGISPQQNGMLNPGTTPNSCASDIAPNGQVSVLQQKPEMQHPQQQVQLVTSFSTVPLTNIVLPFEPPAPTVNLAAQRSIDPDGRDLPSDTSTLRFFYNVGCDYYRMCSTSVQACVVPPVQGYNGNFSVACVPYMPDSSTVVPDVRCNVPDAGAPTNGFGHNPMTSPAPGFGTPMNSSSFGPSSAHGYNMAPHVAQPQN
ncbi:uncharacterized protein LOC144128873 isoform X3 [Amblyomma americanum]